MIFGESIVRLYTYNLPSDYLVDMRCKTFYIDCHFLSQQILSLDLLGRTIDLNQYTLVDILMSTEQKTNA